MFLLLTAAGEEKSTRWARGTGLRDGQVQSQEQCPPWSRVVLLSRRGWRLLTRWSTSSDLAPLQAAHGWGQGRVPRSHEPEAGRWVEEFTQAGCEQLSSNLDPGSRS